MVRVSASRLGIRGRTTLVAVIVVGMALGLSVAVLLIAARAGVQSSISASAQTRAQDIALLTKAGALPPRIPGSGESLLAQVLDSSGSVVASSGSIEGQDPLVNLALDPGATRTYKVRTLSVSHADDAGEGGADTGVPFLIAAVGVKSPSGPKTVVVAASLSPVDQLASALLPPLLAGLPVLLLVVGITVWVLTGTALKPVEAIRAEAADIGAYQLDRRVPVPLAEDEIHRLAVTMNQMLSRLEDSAAKQRRFVADASHELKSPAAAIRTMLDVARANPESVDYESLLRDLQCEDERLEGLVADLVTLAHSDEGVLDLAAIDVDLDDIVLAEVAAVRAASRVSVDSTGVRPVRMQGQPERLRQLARNLLDNAANHANGEVWVTVESVAGEAVVRVSDDGPGIPPSNRERVFDRFVRLDEGRDRESGGTGLGLAVARAIARAHGGDVAVVEPLHGGATFEVSLPLGKGR